MSSLRSTLDTLAQSFANGVLSAIRGASIEDLLAESGGRGSPRRGPGRPPKTAKRGRLARRSAEEIEATLASVLALVKKNKGGLKAEDIKNALGLEPREMPRILKTGLAAKKLRAKGQKRATTYSALR